MKPLRTLISRATWRCARALAITFVFAACNGTTGPDADPDCELRWEFATPGALPLSVERDVLSRPYLYVAQKEGGVLVLHTPAGASPAEAARVPVSAFGGLNAMTLVQQGSRLFVGLGDFFAAQGSRTGLAVVDVADPERPSVSALWVSSDVVTGTTALLVDGSYAYLAAKKNGVLIFDVSQPDTTRLIGSILPDVHFPKPNPSSTEHPNARGFALVGNTLFLANDAGGLRVIDVSNRAQPREVAKYINSALPPKPQAYNAVLVNGTTAYVTLDYCGLEILDVSDPQDIEQIGWWNPWGCDAATNVWFNSAGHTNQIALDVQRRLVYMSAGASELVVVDVANPAQPVLHAQYEVEGGDQAAWGIEVTPTETYLAYITALIPYRGTWAGVRAVTTPR
jgi:hypothetical protein